MGPLKRSFAGLNTRAKSSEQQMKNTYDDYYKTENIFGEPYQGLIDYFSFLPKRGKLLDLGCGQGRDAIALARLGFQVTGIDSSSLGITQMNAIAKKEDLPLIGLVADIYTYPDFQQFDFILLDSIFHFGKKEKSKEIELLGRIFQLVKPAAIITICIQNSGKKVKILSDVISQGKNLSILKSEDYLYEFVDKATNHISKTKYQMVVLQKVEK